MHILALQRNPKLQACRPYSSSIIRAILQYRRYPYATRMFGPESLDLACIVDRTRRPPFACSE